MKKKKRVSNLAVWSLTVFYMLIVWIVPSAIGWLTIKTAVFEIPPNSPLGMSAFLTQIWCVGVAVILGLVIIVPVFYVFARTTLDDDYIGGDSL